LILDFTCTACRRPGILRDTLESFQANLLGVDMAQSVLYLNLDPVPAEGDGDKVIKVADEFFGKVIPRLPDAPSFPGAVKWCWTRPQTEHFFHLEDDWLLIGKANVDEMRYVFDSKPNLACVNCRAYSHDDDRICLAPGLWKSEAGRVIADRLVLHANPERQLRRTGPGNSNGGKHDGYVGVQWPRFRRQVVLRDIGRTWLSTLPYGRDGGRDFTHWKRLSPKRDDKITPALIEARSG
jgi:hypothetical protein